MLDILFRGRYAPVNMLLAVVAFVALTLVFTQVVSDTVTTTALSVLIAAIFTAYMVQFSGRRWPMGVMLMITVFAAFLYSWPIQSLLPTYLKSDLGYSEAGTSAVLFFSGLGAAAGCWLAGFTGDRFGTARAYWGSLLVSQVLIFTVFLIGGKSLVALGVLIFVQQ